MIIHSMYMKICIELTVKALKHTEFELLLQKKMGYKKLYHFLILRVHNTFNYVTSFNKKRIVHSSCSLEQTL